MRNRTLKQYNPWYGLCIAFFLIVGAACSSNNDNGKANAQTTEAPSTSIYAATLMEDVKTVQKHIEAGTDLDTPDEYGSTPLHIAATFNKPEVAKVLIDGGANLEVKSGDGSTALHIAAFMGRKEIAQALVAAGANLDARNNYGSTPLINATTPFEEVKPIYDQLNKDLGPLGFKLHYDKLQATRPEIAELLTTAKNQK